jgi:hypothetical protein
MQTTSRTSSAAGWAVIAVLFAATTCVESMSWNQLSAYTPLYLRELHVPAAEVPRWIAAISSLGWIIALPLAPLWGVLEGRHRPQRRHRGGHLRGLGPVDRPVGGACLPLLERIRAR